jgi:hypothetical protein
MIPRVLRRIPAALLLALELAAAPRVSADVITQVNAEGRQVVLQRDAIVVRQDSSSIVYKHFDLPNRRVVKETLQESSLPYSVTRSSPDSRQQIVDLWKKFGFTATVTDSSGKATRVYDVYVDFYPPGGEGSLLEAIPARTDFPMELSSGGADTFDFDKITHVQFQGDQMQITLSNGQVKQGKFLMPTRSPAEARFLGITDHYDPASFDVYDFSLPLTRIREIDFEQ